MFQAGTLCGVSTTPGEEISLQFEVNCRGAVVDLASVKMDFHYNDRLPKDDAWSAETTDIPNYESGGDGPEPADALLAAEGNRAWRPVGPSAEARP